MDDAAITPLSNENTLTNKSKRWNSMDRLTLTRGSGTPACFTIEDGPIWH